MATALPSIGLGLQARGPHTPGCVASGQVTSSEPKQPPLFSGVADGPQRRGGMPHAPQRTDPRPRHPTAQRPVLLRGRSLARGRAWPEPHRAPPVPAPGRPCRDRQARRATGRGRSCRRRLGPSAHGTREECSFLCPAHPARAAWHTQAWLSARPGAQWGALTAQAVGAPTSPPRWASLSFCVPTGPREDSARASWSIMHTQGPGDPPGAPTLPWAASAPRPPRPQTRTHTRGRPQLQITGLERRRWQAPSTPSAHRHPSFRSLADTPRQPARTDSHPAPRPLPCTRAQECRGRPRPARAGAPPLR